MSEDRETEPESRDESDHVTKSVTFGGKLHHCLRRFDQGDRTPLEFVITQLNDTELDYRKSHKLILEV